MFNTKIGAGSNFVKIKSIISPRNESGEKPFYLDEPNKKSLEIK